MMTMRTRGATALGILFFLVGGCLSGPPEPETVDQDQAGLTASGAGQSCPAPGALLGQLVVRQDISSAAVTTAARGQAGITAGDLGNAALETAACTLRVELILQDPCGLHTGPLPDLGHWPFPACLCITPAIGNVLKPILIQLCVFGDL
jgi:hypothetical protein